MINLEEFKKFNKSKMVITIIENMVLLGWDISNFVYSFKSYTKEELIKLFNRLLEYQKRH